MTKYRSVPTVVDAIRWSGDNHDDIRNFIQDMGLVKSTLGGNLQVWDKLHDSWVTCKQGQWLIRGTKGELYPCDNDVFIERYEEA